MLGIVIGGAIFKADASSDAGRVIALGGLALAVIGLVVAGANAAHQNGTGVQWSVPQ